MDIGIIGPGFGPAATAPLLRAAARTAERVGFSTLWLGEHAVLFDGEAEKHYPDSNPKHKSGSMMLDPHTAIVDSVVGMTWAAAATSSIEIGSAVIILPQHHPVVLAKELATLDAFSNGRLVLGAGSGWSPLEYAATGGDWERRGARMDEYVGALRALLGEAPASFAGETVSFERAYLYPRPSGSLPILFGGESKAVRSRVARIGDGWLPVNLAVEDAPPIIAELHEMTRQAGRDPGQLRINKTVTIRDDPDDMERYRDAGVTEFRLNCFGDLPGNEADLVATVEDFASRLIDRVARL